MLSSITYQSGVASEDIVRIGEDVNWDFLKLSRNEELEQLDSKCRARSDVEMRWMDG